MVSFATQGCRKSSLLQFTVMTRTPPAAAFLKKKNIASGQSAYTQHLLSKTGFLTVLSLKIMTPEEVEKTSLRQEILHRNDNAHVWTATGSQGIEINI